jgi:hypothetical protein
MKQILVVIKTTGESLWKQLVAKKSVRKTKGAKTKNKKREREREKSNEQSFN